MLCAGRLDACGYGRLLYLFRSGGACGDGARSGLVLSITRRSRSSGVEYSRVRRCSVLRRAIGRGVSCSILLRDCPGRMRLMRKVCRLVIRAMTCAKGGLIVTDGRLPARFIGGQFVGLGFVRVRCMVSDVGGGAARVGGVGGCLLTTLCGTPTAVRKCCRTTIGRSVRS